MIPIGMFVRHPEDAAAEIAYIEKRGYPILTWRWAKSQTATTRCRRITWRYTSSLRRRCTGLIRS